MSKFKWQRTESRMLVTYHTEKIHAQAGDHHTISAQIVKWPEEHWIHARVNAQTNRKWGWSVFQHSTCSATGESTSEAGARAAAMRRVRKLTEATRAQLGRSLGESRTVTEKDAWGHDRVVGGHTTVKHDPGVKP